MEPVDEATLAEGADRSHKSDWSVQSVEAVVWSQEFAPDYRSTAVGSRLIMHASVGHWLAGFHCSLLHC